jgi:hypothetical protein
VTAGRGLAYLVAAALSGAATLEAQPSVHPTGSGATRDILVLRADQAPDSRAATHVERSLREALRELGFVVTASPMPFRDAQLAAGCPGNLRECGASVAGAAQGGRLAVSALQEREDQTTLSLHLYSFSASGEAREGSSELSASSPQQIEAAVRQLARSVYGPAAPRGEAVAGRERTARRREKRGQPAADAAGANPAPAGATPGQPQATRTTPHDPLWVVGWSTTALGSALLVSGVATQLSARNGGEAYAGERSRSAADELLGAHERAERQQDTARVLYGAGGALLLTGATLLVWERLAANRENSLRAALLPSTHGATLSLAGRFGAARP